MTEAGIIMSTSIAAGVDNISLVHGYHMYLLKGKIS